MVSTNIYYRVLIPYERTMNLLKQTIAVFLITLSFSRCQEKQVENSPEAGKYQKLAIDILTTLNQRNIVATTENVIDTEPLQELYEIQKVVDDDKVESLILPKEDIHRQGKVVEAKISTCANSPSFSDDTMKELIVDLDSYEGLKGDQLLIHIKTYGAYSDDCVSNQKKLKKLFIYHMNSNNRKYDFEMVVNLGEQ